MLIDPEDLSKLDGWKVRVSHCGHYAYASFQEIIVPVHRLILDLSKYDKRESDHIDPRYTFDNRRSNLRIATRQQNNWNTRKKRTNTSGHKGVSWHKNKQMWHASISVNCKSIFLGCFANLQDAANAYAEAAKRYRGEYARIQ